MVEFNPDVQENPALSVAVRKRALNLLSRADLPSAGAVADGTTAWAGGLSYQADADATTLADKPGWVPLPPFYFEQFGAVGDQATDDIGPLQAAVAYVKSLRGGEIFGGPKKYRVSQPLVIDHSAVKIIGTGQAAFRPPPTEVSVASAGVTVIEATTTFPADGSAVVAFETPTGAFRCHAGGLDNIYVSGAGRAHHALRVRTWERGSFTNLTLGYATIANLDLDVVTTATLAAGTIYDTHFNKFRNIFCLNRNRPSCNNAYALRTRAFENIGGVNPDPVPASIGNPNVSYNVFENCFFEANEQHSTWLEGATDNVFIRCDTNVVSDPEQDSLFGWPLLSVDQDSRLNAAITKRNLWIKCSGRFWARSGQSGGKSSVLNRVVDHLTSVRGTFQPPVTYETPSGGSLMANLLLQLDVGDFGRRRLLSEYSEAETRRQFLDIEAVSHTVNFSGAVTSVTVEGAIPAGAVVVGVTTRVVTAIFGAAGYTVGTAADPDRFGSVTGFTVGTKTDNADWTDSTIQLFTDDTDLVITRTTGAFSGGTLRLSVFYFIAKSEHS
jgi:hypothetical protein